MISEFFNKLYNRSFNYKINFIAFFSFIMMFVMKLRGIKINKCKFYGKPRFIRSPKSLISVGENCRFRSISDSNLIGINHKCIISTHQESSKLIIGNNCGFSGTTIGCFSNIHIGNNVKCGANTLITDSDWHLEDIRSGEPQSIIIEDNVWLGYGVVVMKGVTIGRNAIIGINSVVTRDIPEFSIAAGSPCKVIRSLK